MRLFTEFVLAFAVAGWIVEWVLNPLTRLVWQKVVLWGGLVVMGFRQRVKEEVAHGND